MMYHYPGDPISTVISVRIPRKLKGEDESEISVFIYAFLLDGWELDQDLLGPRRRLGGYDEALAKAMEA